MAGWPARSIAINITQSQHPVSPLRAVHHALRAYTAFTSEVMHHFQLPQWVLSLPAASDSRLQQHFDNDVPDRKLTRFATILLDNRVNVAAMKPCGTGRRGRRGEAATILRPKVNKKHTCPTNTPGPSRHGANFMVHENAIDGVSIQKGATTGSSPFGIAPRREHGLTFSCMRSMSSWGL